MSFLSTNLGFHNNKSGGSVGLGDNAVLARVYDIILDDTHPNYELLGGSQSIGAIKYNIFGNDTFDEKPENLFIAYPLDAHIKTYPLLNEIVLIVKGPKENLERSDSETKDYYTFVYSTWNLANHNATPFGEASSNFDVNLGYTAIEQENVPSLYPNHGDTLITGRLGTSIRLGGYDGKYNNLTEEDNQGAPFMIISNGKPIPEDDSSYSYENINRDSSSIYLTDNHKVKLVEARNKNISAVEKNTIASSYKGAQIVLNSNRLFFNAKENDIILSAKESIAASGLDINLDGEEYISLDAKKIYLGHLSKDFDTQDKLPQPVIKGDELELFLQDLIQVIKELGDALKNAKTIDQKPILTLNSIGPIITSVMKNLKSKINPLKKDSTLKSKKVFVE